MDKLKIIELNYHCHPSGSPAELLALHQAASGFVMEMKDWANIILVKHRFEACQVLHDGAPCHFFVRRNRFWQIPWATHRFIKKEKPDVIIVQGFVFPLQVMALRMLLGKQPRIIAQHHGESPWKGIKGWAQRMADRYIHAYTFTGIGNAEPWLRRKIIAHPQKCVEVLEAAPRMERHDKADALQKTGMQGQPSFLWVGRLNPIKDPLTVVTAFAQYLVHQPLAKLYMVYQEADLLEDIKALLDKDARLQQALQLIGKLHNQELAFWFSAADYYLSGSHREGSGFALLEAMCCGCIPIVTDIPSFKKITNDGKLGFFYPPGQRDALLQVLLGLDGVDKNALRAEILAYAQAHFTHRAIANEMMGVVEKLIMDN